MRLIAKKPCSFGGHKFFIGDEIPEGLVVDAKMQEAYGVIAIANGDAVEGAELKEAHGFASFDGTVIISVKGESDGENGPATAVPATPEEIKQVFSVMQMNAEDGARAVAEVSSENVLILLHAADSRKGIKAAARKQAEALFGDGNPDSGMENKDGDEKSKDGEEGDGG